MRQKWDTVIRPRRGRFDIGLKELPRYRDLIFLLVKRNFTLIYRQTILGPAWIVLQPLLTTLIFTVVFGNLAGLPTDGMPKFLFYMSANVLWHFFSGCLTRSANTFNDNRKLFGKVYFPRLCMPVSVVLSELINFGVQFLLFLGFVIFYAVNPASTVAPDWRLILLTPLLLVQIGLLGMGFGLIVTALTTRYRDLALLVSFGVRLWMYLSPVTYSSAMIAEKYPELLPIYMLNPVTPVINVFRSAYLGCPGYGAGYSLLSAAVTLAVLALGIALFARTERTFMDTI